MNLKHQISIAVFATILASFPTISLGASTYVVAKGDTLYSISKKHNISVEEIKSLNGLSSNRISRGALLVVKASEGGSPAKAKTGKFVAANKSKSKDASLQKTTFDTHSVEKGQTLAIIARDHGTTVKQLKKMNGLRNNRLQVGQLLKVPAGSGEVKIADNGQPAREKTVNETAGEAAATVKLAQEPGPVDTAIEDLSPMEALRIQHLVDVASNYLGVPYKFGGANRKGIDCSAFVQKVFGFLSVDLPRTAREQFRIGEGVAKSELKEGDLVFFKTYAKFPSHVGIYIGDNKFIHASSVNKKVSVSTLDEPYYTKRFIGAKRLPVQDQF